MSNPREPWKINGFRGENLHTIFMEGKFNQIPLKKLIPIIDNIWTKEEIKILEKWAQHFMDGKIPFAITWTEIIIYGTKRKLWRLWKEKRC